MKTLIELNTPFDDYEIDEDGHKWSQLCEHHKRQMETKTEWISEAPSTPICGVKGCNKESDYYIDF